MENPSFSLIFLLNLVLTVLGSKSFSRNDFPPDFVFGSGTSAYQVEGAAAEDGRTPSIWDTFAHSGRVPGNGDTACDGYHKYKEDVQLMVDTGLEGYRFSISWSRLIPNGRGPVNPKGLAYYNNLIDELISIGVQPHVTLHHMDLPQALEDEYGGWLSQNIVKDFTDYADVCFREFGDQVKYWTTINEGNIFAVGGYDQGIVAPQRCSPPYGSCPRGNSTIEPYIAAHYMLLSHASAANLYKRKYQEKQNGFIGINIYPIGTFPATNKTEDELAAKRVNEFFIGWFADPLVFGDYPETMRKNIGTRLPAFTDQESKLVKGSFDFIGLNYYIAFYIKDNPNSLKRDLRDFNQDMAAQLQLISGMSPFEMTVIRLGLQQVLEYFKQVYGNPPLYIHENGYCADHSSSLNDTRRVEYMRGYIGGVLESLRNGSNTRGYFSWSFLDVYELLTGYQTSCGLYHVDFNDKDLKRYPKLSAHWYSNFLEGGSVDAHLHFELGKFPAAPSQSYFSQ